MPSEVDIVNLALMQIGGNQITSMEDGNTRSNVAKAFYPIARDALLEEHPWNFAETRAVLARVAGDTPAFGFDYFYQLPPDFIRARKINESDSEAYPHRIEGNKLLTDLSSVSLLYTRREKDPNRFSSLFVLGLVYRLASLFAVPLLKDAKKALEMEQLAMSTVNKAKGSDATQGTPQKPVNDDLIRVR